MPDVSKQIVAEFKANDAELISALARLQKTFTDSEERVNGLQAAFTNLSGAANVNAADLTKVAMQLERAKARMAENQQLLSQFPTITIGATNATNAFGNAVRDSGTHVDGLTSRLEQLARGAASSVFGFTLLAGGFVAAGHVLANVAQDATQAFRDLEQEVANISSIAPEFDTRKLFSQLSEMQTRIPATSKQLAEALYDIVSSVDVSQEQAMNLLEQTARGAVATLSDQKTWAAGVVGAMNAYGMSLDDVNHIQDVFFNTVKEGVLTGAQLSKHFGEIAPAAQSAGVSLEEAAAAYAVVTRQGRDAAMAATQVKDAFEKIHTDRAEKEFAALGIRVKELNGNYRDLIPLLSELKVKMDGMSESAKDDVLKKMFADVRAQAGAKALLNDLQDLEKWTNDNTTAMNAYGRAADTNTNTAAAKAKEMAGEVKAGEENIGSFISTIFDWKQHLAGLATMVKEQLDDNSSWSNLNQQAQAAGVTIEQLQHQYDMAAQVVHHAQDEMAEGAAAPEKAQAQSAENVNAALASNEQAIAQWQDLYSRALLAGTQDTEDFWRKVDEIKPQLEKAFTDLSVAGEVFASRHNAAWGSAGDMAETQSIRIQSAANRAKRALAEISSAVDAANISAGILSHNESEKADRAGDPAYSGLAKGTYWYKKALEDADKKLHPWLYEKPAKAAGGGGGKPPSGYGDDAADAQRQIDQTNALEAAKKKLEAAQARLNNTSGAYKMLIDEIKEKESALAAEEKARLEPLDDQLKQISREAKVYGMQSEEALHDMDVRLKSLNQTLDDTKSAADRDLGALNQRLEEAKQAMDRLRAATAEQDEAFARTAHGLSNSLYAIENAEHNAMVPLEANVMAISARLDQQREAAQALAQSYEDQLVPLQRELNALNQEDVRIEQQKDLHDRAQSIDNIVARMQQVQAGSAEWLELDKQRAHLQDEQGRKSKEYSLTNQISAINAAKEAAMQASQAEIRATEEQLKSAEKARDEKQKMFDQERALIEKQQALLEHQRAEFDYQQHQKELAAQADINNAQHNLDVNQALWKQAEDAQKANIDMLQKLRDERSYGDQEMQRFLSNESARIELTKSDWQQYYDGIKKPMDDQLDRLGKEQKAAEDAGKAEVTAAQNYYNNLKDQFDYINKIDSATDKIRNANREMATKQAEIQAALDKQKSTVPEVQTKYDDYGNIIKEKVTPALTNVTTAHQDLVTKGMKPLKDELDPNVQNGLAAQWHKAWDGTQPGSFEDLHNTSLHEIGNAMIKLSDGVIGDWHRMTTAADGYLKKLNDINSASGPPTGDTEHRATGGPVRHGRMYWVGEHGPELFMAGSDGFIVPNGGGGMAYGPGSRAMGGVVVNVNVNVPANGVIMPTNKSAYRESARAISQAIREHMTYTGRA